MTSNPAAAAFFRQAESDWGVFRLLREQDQADCHRLHYLQMAVEKLVKAHAWKIGDTGLDHAIVPRWRQMRNSQAVRAALAMDHEAASFRRRMTGVEPALEALASLAPALAGDGPNCEYPWPASLPAIAPVDHRFDLVEKLVRGGLLVTLEQLFATHDRWL